MAINSKIRGYIGQIDPGDNTNYSIGSTVYAECDTAEGTAEKVVNMTGFNLIIGATVYIKFINANTADSPTLNIENQGAKPIIQNNLTTTYWPAGTLLELTYDGTSWLTEDLINYNLQASNLNSTITISTPIVSYNNNKLEYNEYVQYLRKPTIIDSSTSPAVQHYATGLKILGSLTGNNDNLNVSGQRGVFSINQPGPQIRFGYINDVESNQGALIYTNNNISSNGKNENSFGGSSFHFVADGEKPTKLVAGGYTSIDGIKSSVTLLNLQSIEGTVTSTTGNTIISTLTTDRREEAFIRYYLPSITTTYSGGIATTSSMQNSRFVFAQRSPKSLTNTSTTASNEMPWEFYRLPITTSDLQSSQTYEILTSKIPANQEVLGGIKIGYTQTGQNYPIELDNNNQAYVNVPWTNTTYVFDSNYNASSNKAATMASITNEINKLNVSNISGFGKGKTLSALSETNGKISASFQDIEITKSQVSDFPSSMPASDVSAWAKAANKPSYSLSEITSASDVQAIEALTGTSGFLKKTAANKWELDTTTYVTSSGVTSITLKAGTGISLDTDNTAITTSGTRTISLADNYGDTKNPYGTKNKNLILATPSNTSGVPNFRALVENDIPDLNASKINAGTLDFDRLPTMYWANVAISNTSATNKSPTFGTVTINNGANISNTLYVKSGYFYLYPFSSSYNTNGGTAARAQMYYNYDNSNRINNTIYSNANLSVPGIYTTGNNSEIKGQLTVNAMMVNGNSSFNNQVSFNNQIPTALTAENGDNSTKLATTAFVTNAVTSLSGPMRFIGTLGTGGTVTSIDAAAASNKGYAYKVITTATYQGISAKEGDLLVSNGQSWILIPSGDEPSGTVTNIKLEAGSGISINSEAAITTSGTRTISHANTSSVSNMTTGGRTYINSIEFDSFGHVTGISTGTESETISSSWATATATGPILSVTVNNVNTTATIPIASDTQSGVVTTSNQTFKGTKTFYNETTTNDDDYASILFTIKDSTIPSNKTQSASSIIRVYSDHKQEGSAGTNFVLQSGGNTIIGSGEAGLTYYNKIAKTINNDSTQNNVIGKWNNTSENFYLLADTSLYLEANNNIPSGETNPINRTGVMITTGGNVIPVAQELNNPGIQSLGNTDAAWKNLYLTNSIVSTTKNLSITLNNNITKIWIYDNTTTATYNSRNITPSLYVNGTGYFDGAVEASTNFINNVNPTGGGFYIKSQDVEYGRLYVNTQGTTTTTGVARLILGNATATGNIGNAQGSIYLYSSSGTYVNILNNNTTTSVQVKIPNYNGHMVLAHVGNTNNAIGSSTTPVYVEGNGKISAGSTYAGGTKVTLNGTDDRGATTASFYAPTSSGTSGTQALVSSGANTAPTWTNIAPSISITAGDSSNAPKINVSVLGQTGTASAITVASTTKYGVTKLSSDTDSTATNIAATPAAVKAAIQASAYAGSIQTTSAATYNTEPEVKSIKITGNTSANTIATNGVVLQYDTTLKVLNFVFA